MEISSLTHSWSWWYRLEISTMNKYSRTWTLATGTLCPNLVTSRPVRIPVSIKRWVVPDKGHPALSSGFHKYTSTHTQKHRHTHKRSLLSFTMKLRFVLKWSGFSLLGVCLSIDSACCFYCAIALIRKTSRNMLLCGKMLWVDFLYASALSHHPDK